MAEVEGISEAVDELEPHWEAILASYERERRRYDSLFFGGHDHIGRVLKCHLVVEHYLERFLIEEMALDQLKSARLSFFQKAALLPSKHVGAAWIRPGILELNTIRNNLVHELSTDPADVELRHVTSVLRIARPKQNFSSAVDRIEAFTPVACAVLIPADKTLQEVFARALRHIRTRETEP